MKKTNSKKKSSKKIISCIAYYCPICPSLTLIISKRMNIVTRCKSITNARRSILIRPLQYLKQKNQYIFLHIYTFFHFNNNTHFSRVFRYDYRFSNELAVLLKGSLK